ncbi:MAG: DUF58 domain-containing protein [Planctomycetes bacterium]|nr:DUF58 domain-containing protein [Planctomycetota bacterium]
MIPTTRALFAAGVLGVVALAGAFVPALRPVGLVLDLVFVALFVLDYVRTPAPARLAVQRKAPERAGLSQDFARVVRVRAEGLDAAHGLRLELHERFPTWFEVRARSVADPAEREQPSRDERGLVAPAAGDPSGGPDVTVVPAAGPIDLVRVYSASKRGVHALGDLRLRLRGRLGLVERQSRLAGAQPVRVEPPLLNLKRTLQLAASERWRDLGVRRLRRRGGMTEFESLRDLVRGDDVRLVDWKASARRGKPIVREYQEERGQELILVFDCGRRMSATSSEDPERVDARSGRPVRGWTKLDHALDAGLQIAAVALQEGDRVGVLAYDDKVRVFVPPGKAADQLERLKTAVFALESSTRESDLERALRELALRHRRRALVLLLTDVADPLSVERQRQALATGTKKHRILFASLDDPSLRAAAEGRLDEPAAVRAAAFALIAEREKGLAELRGLGIRVLDALPAEGAAPLLAAWLEARRGAG